MNVIYSFSGKYAHTHVHTRAHTHTHTHTHRLPRQILRNQVRVGLWPAHAWFNKSTLNPMAKLSICEQIAWQLTFFNLDPKVTLLS